MGISREQALDCFRSDDLVGIGMEADAVRRRLHPEDVVSYLLECSVTGTLENQDIFFGHIADAVENGCSVLRIGELLAQSVGNLEDRECLFRAIRQRFPGLWIEALAAPEILALAAESKLGVQQTLVRLQAAGLNSISGESASAPQGGSGLQQWLDLHRAAHRLGMRTSATMVFGAGETLEQRVDFLDAILNLQEETGGFAAFIPISTDAPGGRDLDGVTAVERLKMLAIARMFLDTINNVQLSHSGQGLKVLQMGLRFGANDIGAVSISAAGGAAEEDVRRIIRDAGFIPAQRDAPYRSMFLN